MDKALKQRLVGASVLVALAVVVLPMLFSGQPGSSQDTRSIEVPPKPAELSFETRRFPLGARGAQDGNSANTVPVPEPEPVETAPRQSNGEDQAQNTPKQTEGPSAESSPEPVAVNSAGNGQPGRYLVQVASFSTTANANRLVARLREDGMSVMMDSVTATVGTLHRVRVGPFDQIEEANTAMSQIRTQTPDVNPRIIDLRPEEAAPVTDPSDPLARWVVQVGSFSAQDNAEKLVAQLRSSGFSAFSVSVQDSTGIRYKVRVGPEIERQSAARIAGEIREKMNIEGIVMVGD